MHPFITGTKINLCILTKSDITDEYVNWFNDKEDCQFNSHYRFPNTYEKTLHYIENTSDIVFGIVTKQKHSHIGNTVFGIVTEQESRHIGNICLQNINWIDRTADISIIIGEKTQWGKGYGAEAYRLIIDYAFNVLNLRRLASALTTDNQGMRWVCAKNGMEYEGTSKQVLFKAGEYIDIVHFAILKQ